MNTNINLTFDATRLFAEIVRTQSMIKALAFHQLGPSKYLDFVSSLPDYFGKSLIDYVERNRDIISDADETIRQLLKQMEDGNAD